MLDTGVASPNAQGQAIINTATAATRPCANRGSGPQIPQIAKESKAMPSTAGTNQPATLSRSEEHTSELQSLMRISYAVFCLKKKNKTNAYDTHVLYQHIYDSSLLNTP